MVDSSLPASKVDLSVRWRAEQLRSGDVDTLTTTTNWRGVPAAVSTTDRPDIHEELSGTTQGRTSSDSSDLRMLLALTVTLHVILVTSDVTLTSLHCGNPSARQRQRHHL